MPLSRKFVQHFEPIKDPRRPFFNFRHELHDILAITILGTICGADNWLELHAFAKSKKDWLKTFLLLPNGVPSHDTFERVFAALDSAVFEACFTEWVATLRLDLQNTKEIIAVDGKTLRGSHNWRKDQKALHLVSAWAVENRLVLAQVKT